MNFQACPGSEGFQVLIKARGRGQGVEIVGRAGVTSHTKCWKHLDVHIDVTTHALHSPYQPLLEIISLRHVSSVLTCEYSRVIIRILNLAIWSWEDYCASAYFHFVFKYLTQIAKCNVLTVQQIHNTILLQVACLQDVTRREIVLLCRGKIVAGRAD
jgi:hypothetical protein